MALAYLVLVRPDPFFNPNVVPKIVTSNFVDISQVYMVSKYRSGAGHDYSLNGETCRSMKHYFNTSHNYDPNTHIPLRSQPTSTEPNIKIYAPFDGLIFSVGSENTPIGKQVEIMSFRNPFYNARLFHIDLLPGLGMGSIVKSGQQIAIIGPKDGTDIAIESSQGGLGGVGVSYFEAMTDAAFKPYADLGYQRSDFIVSKDYRDGHPLQCSHDKSDSFVQDTSRYSSNEDFVHLRPDPFGDLPQGPGAPAIQIGPPQR